MHDVKRIAISDGAVYCGDARQPGSDAQCVAPGAEQLKCTATHGLHVIVLPGHRTMALAGPVCPKPAMLVFKYYMLGMILLDMHGRCSNAILNVSGADDASFIGQRNGCTRTTQRNLQSLYFRHDPKLFPSISSTGSMSVRVSLGKGGRCAACCSGPEEPGVAGTSQIAAGKVSCSRMKTLPSLLGMSVDSYRIRTYALANMEFQADNLNHAP